MSREPRKYTEWERLDLIATWSEWFIANTDTWDGGLGLQLAYLWPAIVKGKYVDAEVHSPLVRLALGQVAAVAPLNDERFWDFVHVV